MRRMKTMKHAKADVHGTQHPQGATRRGTRLSSMSNIISFPFSGCLPGGVSPIDDQFASGHEA